MLSPRVLAISVVLFCAFSQSICSSSESHDSCYKEDGCVPPPATGPRVNIEKMITNVANEFQSTIFNFAQSFVFDILNKGDFNIFDIFGVDMIPTDIMATFTSIYKNLKILENAPPAPEMFSELLRALSLFVERFVEVLTEIKKHSDETDSKAVPISEWFDDPVKMMLKLLVDPVSHRTISFEANTMWKEPTKDLYNTILNVVTNIWKTILEKEIEDKGKPMENKSMVEAGLYYLKNVYMEFSGYYTHPSVTMFATNHFEILRKLDEKEIGMANQFVNMVMYLLWSGTGFNMVHKELLKECGSNRQELKFTVIEGEEYDPEDLVALNNFMDVANANRSAACEEYRVGDEDSRDAYTYIAKQFTSLMRSTYDTITPIRQDVKAVDLISQTLLGEMSAVCFKWNLCRIGEMLDYLPLNSTEAYLLWGLLVNGHTTFSGFMKTGLVSKVGTPKMARALQDGIANQCSKYMSSHSVCSPIEKFLEDYKDVKKDMLTKELNVKETSSGVVEDHKSHSEDDAKAEGDTEFWNRNKGRFERTTDG